MSERLYIVNKFTFPKFIYQCNAIIVKIWKTVFLWILDRLIQNFMRKQTKVDKMTLGENRKEQQKISSCHIYIYITVYYKCDLESETEIAQVEQNRESRNRPRQMQDFGRGNITNQWVKGALLYK